LNSFVNQLSNDVFSTNGLFCKICEVKVVADKKFIIYQHILRITHINGVEFKKPNQEQSTSEIQRLITVPSKKSSFMIYVGHYSLHYICKHFITKTPE